ncbi:MAG: DUF721 domain-containing protein [Sphingobacteriaceae bacterium]|nr:DUF721 domain-containing protein [Sphingobacteriaceae bacterium]
MGRNCWKGYCKSHHFYFFDDQKNIFLSLDSAAVKNEAMYSKESIVKKINQFCGYELVKNLVIK